MTHTPIEYDNDEIEDTRLQKVSELTKDKSLDQLQEENKPGTFGYHGAFHATLILMDTVGQYLMDDSAIALDKEAFRLAHQAHTALFNLYQYLGIEHAESEPPAAVPDRHGMLKKGL